MKKMVFFALTAFLFSACKKESNCSINSSSIAGTYKVTSAKYKASSSSPEVDGTALFFSRDCEKDNTITFNANGSYTYNDAGVACDPVESYSGSWSATSSAIIVDGDTTPIQSFNCTNMVVVLENYDIDGDKLTVTYTK